MDRCRLMINRRVPTFTSVFSFPLAQFCLSFPINLKNKFVDCDRSKNDILATTGRMTLDCFRRSGSGHKLAEIFHCTATGMRRPRAWSTRGHRLTVKSGRNFVSTGHYLAVSPSLPQSKCIARSFSWECWLDFCWALNALQLSLSQFFGPKNAFQFCWATLYSFDGTFAFRGLKHWL